MKRAKYKVKIKILVNGFPYMNNKYILDNFELKRMQLNEKDIFNDIDVAESSFSTNGYMSFCTYKFKNDDRLFCNYFESIIPVEINVPIEKTNDKYFLEKYIIESKKINEEIFNFQVEIRLIYNIRILFPMYIFTIYDMNDEKKGFVTTYYDFNAFRFITDFDNDTFEKNKIFRFNMNVLNILIEQNVRFQRAIKLYYDSFDSNNINARYIMLFSAMESLFITSDKNITKNLAICMSRILLYSNKDEELKAYKRIKKLYDYRSKFVHGNPVKITDDIEKELRNIVREVLIIYYSIFQDEKMTPNLIIKKLKNSEEISITSKILAEYLRESDTKKAYENVINWYANSIKKD